MKSSQTNAPFDPALKEKNIRKDVHQDKTILHPKINIKTKAKICKIQSKTKEKDQ